MADKNQVCEFTLSEQLELLPQSQDDIRQLFNEKDGRLLLSRVAAASLDGDANRAQRRHMLVQNLALLFIMVSSVLAGTGVLLQGLSPWGFGWIQPAQRLATMLQYITLALAIYAIYWSRTNRTRDTWKTKRAHAEMARLSQFTEFLQTAESRAEKPDGNKLQQELEFLKVALAEHQLCYFDSKVEKIRKQARSEQRASIMLLLLLGLGMLIALLAGMLSLLSFVFSLPANMENMISSNGFGLLESASGAAATIALGWIAYRGTLRSYQDPDKMLDRLKQTREDLTALLKEDGQYGLAYAGALKGEYGAVRVWLDDVVHVLLRDHEGWSVEMEQANKGGGDFALVSEMLTQFFSRQTP